MSEHAHFDISAAVVRQLGEELVSDEVTAILELVKNAYDADATFANVVVDTEGVINADESSFPETQGSITIEDDGMGMNREEIEGGWLTISLSPKRGMKKAGEQTPKGRTPIGDKGLGRLSTQRLGNQLDLITRKDGSDTVYHVSFSWSEFREDIPLTLVPVRLRTLPAEARRKGTKLLVSALRDPEHWVGDTRDELVRKLSQLIFPFGAVRPFRVYMTINGQRINLEEIAESVRDAAVARFRIEYVDGQMTVEGRIRLSRLRAGSDPETYQRLLGRDLGREFFAYLTSPTNRLAIPGASYLSEDGWFMSFRETRDLRLLGGAAYLQDDRSSDAPVTERSERKLADPGNFHAELDEFLLRGTDLDQFDSVFDRNAEFANYIKTQAGVRLFRNGFGIRPYGVEGNDWLNLGGGQTSGLSFYGLRPGNVIGYVALSEENNSQLREKTDREGLLGSTYSANFFLLMQEAVKIINENYHRLRRSYNQFREMRGKEEGGFESVSAPFAEMRKASAQAERLQEHSVRLAQRLEGVTESVQAVTERVERTPLFASPAESEFAPLLKEVQTTLAEARELVRELQGLLPRAQRLGQIADYVEPKISTLETQLEEFSELAGLGLTAEALSHEIHTVADRLATRTRVMIDLGKKREIQRAEVTTYTEHVLSAVSALRKQLSHLAPSLRYVREQRKPISMRAFFEDLQEFYNGRFQEAGIGFVLAEPFEDFTVQMNRGRLTQIVDNLILNSEYWLKEASRANQISKPHITVHSKVPFFRISDNGPGIDQSVEHTIFQPFVSTKPSSQGRGLGLFIVQQLLDSIGGEISLLPDRNEHGRRYIFQIDLSGVVYGG